MKIGILTYTREYANLGTNMQAYCTLQAIRLAYPDSRVELIDYSPSTPPRRPYFTNISLQSLLLDYRRLRKYDDFFRDELVFSRESLTTQSVARALEFIRQQQYDAIYVGSDTVLELKRNSSEALTAFWLDSSITSVKILVAASSLNVTFEAISPRLQDLMQRAIDGFALVGVRDDATYRLMSHFVAPEDSRLQMVPDPTFTYDIDYSHIERYIEQKKLTFSHPMVCLHLLRDSHWAKELAQSFRDAGYIVASLRPAKYADIIFTDLSPFEQMGLYRYFSLVVTHRFHDAIFCLKNVTPLLAFPPAASDITSYSESKIRSLLEVFGIENTSYMPNKEEVNAESLFHRYPEAMAGFEKARLQIRPLLYAQKEKYQRFICESRRFV